MKVAFFYVPFPSKRIAEKTVKKLVKSRLIACGNILGVGTSIYRWQGKITKSAECYALLKTTPKNAAKLVAEIKRLHPYEVPCIAQLSLKKINAEFAHWINAET
jgi:periplasmic divalent cation tolerance protein